MQTIDVVVILDVLGLNNKELFEKHIKKEGFNIVENEKFVYSGNSTTTYFSTKAYILEVFKKGLMKSGFKSANLGFLLNENSYSYYFDENTKDFEEVKDKR